MMYITHIKGFTIMETMVVIVIFLILLGIAIAGFSQFYNTYTFQKYAYKINYAIKLAKFQAIKNTTYVGICPKTNQIIFYNIGNAYPNSINDACTGTQIDVVNIPTKNYQFQGTNTILDSRGFAIHTPGHYCLYNKISNNYYEICIGKFGSTLIKKGEGTCQSCPQ